MYFSFIICFELHADSKIIFFQISLDIFYEALIPAYLKDQGAFQRNKTG